MSYFKIISKIHNQMMGDKRLKVRKVDNDVDISSERVHNNLHQHLNNRKLSKRRVPQQLITKKDENYFFSCESYGDAKMGWGESVDKNHLKEWYKLLRASLLLDVLQTEKGKQNVEHETCNSKKWNFHNYGI